MRHRFRLPVVLLCCCHRRRARWHCPLASRVMPCCRRQDRVVPSPSSTWARTNIPGNKTCCGFGKTARSVTRPVDSSTATSVNARCPFAVGAAIFRGQGHAKRIVVGRQRLFAQAQRIDAGAEWIDIHGVQPRIVARGRYPVGGNQCAGSDGRDPDTSGNWRGNGGPVQVNTRALQRRLFGLPRWLCPGLQVDSASSAS